MSAYAGVYYEPGRFVGMAEHTVTGWQARQVATVDWWDTNQPEEVTELGALGRYWRMMAGLVRSRDNGTNWTVAGRYDRYPMDELTDYWVWIGTHGVVYRGRPFWVNFGTQAYSDPPRYYLFLNPVIPQNLHDGNVIAREIPEPDATTTWDICAHQVNADGTVFVVFCPDLLLSRTYGPLYFTRSDDLGLTWTTPVAVFPEAPVPWDGGPIYTDSGRCYQQVVLHAEGTHVIIAVLEDWTEQKYICDYWAPYRPPFLPLELRPYPVRYFPMDILYATSNDLGDTWTGVQRFKNDEAQGSGGCNAYGSADPPMASTPLLPNGDNASLCVGSYNGDVYLAAVFWRIYKQMGTYPIEPEPIYYWMVHPNGLIETPVIKTYRIPGWTGPMEFHGEALLNDYGGEITVCSNDAEMFLFMGAPAKARVLWENGVFTHEDLFDFAGDEDSPLPTIASTYPLPYSGGAYSYWF